MAKVNTPGAQFIIVCGLSFAGKSTLGKAIAERFGYEEVDVDETKMNLYGQHCKDENLNPEDWVRIYAETDMRIEKLLKSGKSALDASRNFSRTERHGAVNIAEKTGVPLVTVYVDTPENITRQRLLENRQHPNRRDVSDKDFEDVLRAMNPPAADENPLVFHHASDIDDWLLKNAARLAPYA
jgi:predicted kinase